MCKDLGQFAGIPNEGADVNVDYRVACATAPRSDIYILGCAPLTSEEERGLGDGPRKTGGGSLEVAGVSGTGVVIALNNSGAARPEARTCVASAPHKLR